MTNTIKQIRSQIEALSDSELIDVRDAIDAKLGDDHTADEISRIEDTIVSQESDPSAQEFDGLSRGFWQGIHQEADDRIVQRRDHA